MELKWSSNRGTCDKKPTTKRGAFPDTLFYRMLMILELFLDRFSTVFIFFSKNSKKGRHAFRLRHGERIEGRTYQNGAQTDQKTFRHRPRTNISQQIIHSADLFRFRDPFWSQQMLKIRNKDVSDSNWKKHGKNKPKSEKTDKNDGPRRAGKAPLP